MHSIQRQTPAIPLSWARHRALGTSLSHTSRFWVLLPDAGHQQQRRRRPVRGDIVHTLACCPFPKKPNQTRRPDRRLSAVGNGGISNAGDICLTGLAPAGPFLIRLVPGHAVRSVTVTVVATRTLHVSEVHLVTTHDLSTSKRNSQPPGPGMYAWSMVQRERGGIFGPYATPSSRIPCIIVPTPATTLLTR